MLRDPARVGGWQFLPLALPDFLQSAMFPDRRLGHVHRKAADLFAYSLIVRWPADERFTHSQIIECAPSRNNHRSNIPRADLPAYVPFGQYVPLERGRRLSLAQVDFNSAKSTSP